MSQLSIIDEERSQSHARLAICWISFGVFVLVGWRCDLFGAPVFAKGMAVIAAYSVFSHVWHLAVRRWPQRCHWRRNISMVADIGIVTIYMGVCGRFSAMFYPLFLWIIIGNGIRFGTSYLRRGIVLGAVGFGSLLLTNDYWRTYAEVGIGLLAGVVVLPIFFHTVLGRLRKMQELEVELSRTKLADQAKDQFLATMSHEIRTPMNGVLGMAEALSETELDEDQREHVDLITHSVESLLTIINDILDYSKITADGLSLEAVPFDLHQLLLGVHRLLGGTAATKGLGFDFSYETAVPRQVIGDPTRVRQIVLNLIGNAIKFTREGKVRMVCRAESGCSGDIIIIQVADTGVGIPDDRIGLIFNQFEQADSSISREFGGTGLGLAISRQLARLMGGDVVVSSHVGQGSVFTASLALEAAGESLTDATSLKAVATLAFPQFALRALVAEDNPINCKVIGSIMRRLGIDATIVPDGAAAVAALDAGTFDVVFMDIRMPVMNGYDATRQIRARGGAMATIPILAVTADARRADVKKCLDAGMDRHLSKPLRLAAVAEALAELVPTATVPS